MRKLVSIQQVRKLEPIDGADNIELAHINDWQCVVKKGELEEGGLCCYHEIDSLLPIGGVYDFLASRGTRKSELEDGTIVEGYRLRTIRLKGQLSQGLALPLGSFDFHNGMRDAYFFECPEVGDDVTVALGVHKYELPMNASLRGTARGNFPSFARKSDQERCQNIRREVWDAYVAGDEFQVTVKLDGSSMTTFKIGEALSEQYGTEPRFGVCSRNLELKETEGNAFWDVARRDGFENKFGLLDLMDTVVQGELISPTIQGNFEGVNRPDFYVYNIFDIKDQNWVEPNTARFLAEGNGFKYVPVLHEQITLKDLFPEATQDTIIQQLLDYADGPSAFGGKFREGIVFKRVDGKFSFKAISNHYLLKSKD
jgi:RNA ligase (TIGR02306 family)